MTDGLLFTESIMKRIFSLFLALLLIFISKLIYLYAPYTVVMGAVFTFCLYTAAPLSIGLGLFNLIPIPPLDGSKVVAVLLPNRAYRTLMRYERYGMLLLLALSLLGVSGGFISGVIGRVYEAMFNLIY